MTALFGCSESVVMGKESKMWSFLPNPGLK